MLSRAFIRDNAEVVRLAIARKGVPIDIDELLTLDADVVRLTAELQTLQEERNRLSKSFGRLNGVEREQLALRSRTVGSEMGAIKPVLNQAQKRLQDLLWLVPNVPSPDAPVGPDAEANTVVRQWGEPRTFDFPLRDHVELLEMHDWADLQRVTRSSGSRTYALKGDMVFLEMALHRFVLDRLSGDGFTPITVPSLIRERALYGTGHFPGQREDVYHLPTDDLYLAGTAELVLTDLHSGEILDDGRLPIRYAGFSPCFRREAGSAGKDVRGLLRVHQFTKVEQYVLCRNDVEESARFHAHLLAGAEAVVQALELPYQVVECSTGDMGVGKFRMNDIEVWVPSLERYRETHSCSTLHDWQARRANLRYRDAAGKVQYVHTLNNTGIATPRILVPLLEVHQQADGRVRIPQALQGYLGDRDILG